MEDPEKNETTGIAAGPAPASYAATKQEVAEEEDTDRLLPKKMPKGGFPHLDITRIVCVMLVAIDHGSAMYSEWNVIYVQQWTLQWTLFSHGFPWAGAAMAGARGWKRLEGYKLTKSACARVDLRDGHLALHVEVKQLRIVLVSGVSFCLSGKPLMGLLSTGDCQVDPHPTTSALQNSRLHTAAPRLRGYLARLGTYAAVGIMVNWSAWICMGLDWEHDFFNVVFQMWFIIGLMLFCTILTPLKHWLSEDAKKLEQEEPLPSAPPGDEGVLNIVLMIVMVILAIGPLGWANAQQGFGGMVRYHKDCLPGISSFSCIFCVVLLPRLVNPFLAPVMLHFTRAIGGDDNVWGLPGNMKEANDFITHLCTYAFLTLSNLFLVRMFRTVHVKPSVIPWFMIVNSLINRALMYRGPEERPFHLLDIMILGMVTQTYGLMYRKTVGDYVCRYWFVLLIAFAIIYPPYLDKRLDMYPTFDRILRSKVEVMEAICLLAWLSASDRDKAELAEAASDLAMHLIFGLPYSWIVLVALIPVCSKFRRRETM
eukprot:g29417.t1